ncbi:hypothetical protein [Synechococcus sp. A15-24]|uniref:hypothetical protein n=1 Tax=Synechococcus sp. A15-24 TaxID=1050635 RepID=UPI0016472712|nr:hypothetical protein [Synechococcus sp. A15-24]QNJ27817.1 hypothetical protein SynA1524_00095 [Synechococcus sp. A15-24]
MSLKLLNDRVLSFSGSPFCLPRNTIEQYISSTTGETFWSQTELLNHFYSRTHEPIASIPHRSKKLFVIISGLHRSTDISLKSLITSLSPHLFESVDIVISLSDTKQNELFEEYCCALVSKSTMIRSIKVIYNNYSTSEVQADQSLLFNSESLRHSPNRVFRMYKGFLNSYEYLPNDFTEQDFFLRTRSDILHFPSFLLSLSRILSSDQSCFLSTPHPGNGLHEISDIVFASSIKYLKLLVNHIPNEDLEFFKKYYPLQFNPEWILTNQICQLSKSILFNIYHSILAGKDYWILRSNLKQTLDSNLGPWLLSAPIFQELIAKSFKNQSLLSALLNISLRIENDYPYSELLLVRILTSLWERKSDSFNFIPSE